MQLLPKVFRTEGDIVEFEPQKILESLVKETGMSQEEAHDITELSVRRIISSGMKFLSGPHIREIVCSILSEQHFEKERKLYTRIGMPLMDYEGILEKPTKQINPEKIHHWAANQLSEEYTLLRILDDEESQAHLYGDIHIHQLRYFDLRPTSQFWDARLILKYGLPPGEGWAHCCKSGPASSLAVAVNHLAKWLGMTQGEFSGQQGYEFITMFLAPYAKGITDKEIRQSLQGMVFEINQLSAVIGRNLPTTSLTSSPGILDSFANIPAVSFHGKEEGVYKDYEVECLRIFKALNEVFFEGDYDKKPFKYPYQLIYFKDEWLEKFQEDYEIIWREIEKGQNPYLINLNTKWQMDKVNRDIHDAGRFNHGILQRICLNLPRCAYIARDEDDLIQILRDRLHLCANILLKKFNTIQKRLDTNHLPICSSVLDGKALFSMDKQALAIDFIGLNETIQHLLNQEIHESQESINLSKKILNSMVDTCEEMSKKHDKRFIIQENVHYGVMERFAKLDLKHFPKNALPIKRGEIPLYTNSAFLNDKSKIDLKEKIAIRGEFHELIQNRVIERFSLQELEKLSDNPITYLVEIIKQSKIGIIKVEP